MADADGGRGHALPFARQVARGHGAQQSLAARIQARMAQREEDDRHELAGRIALRQSTLGSISGGLTSRLRASLGGQPLGALPVCQVHRWSERERGPRRVCSVCGLTSDV